MVRILGIETSCDETGIGVVQDGRQILASIVASSQSFHQPYGGVVPEIAARVHVEVLWPAIEQALDQANLHLQDIDAVAVTQGPGLPGALLIGIACAKGLALSLDRPLIGVDHLAAHLYAGEMISDMEPPYVGLIVSGGHTLLCLAHPDQRYEVLGETQDDAVGEAFDKVAKLLGLGYPGGPIIDRVSDEGAPGAVPLPRHASKEAFDFSFSGLKTAVYHHVRARSGEPLDRKAIADIAASFQATAVETLVAKTLKACQRSGIDRIVVGGGVASNRRLRQRLTDEGQARKLRVVFPPPELCVDNGAMVAGAAYPLLRLGRRSALSMNADPNLRLAASLAGGMAG